MADYAKIFKAYDIRGVVPDELDESVAEAVGAAFVRLTGAPAVVTAHDMRTSSAAAGRRVRPRRRRPGRRRHRRRARLDRPALLRAAAALACPGAMITASHNPARYNGIKLCRAGARPVGAGDRPGRDAGDGRGAASQPRPARRARITARDLLAGYAAYLKTLVDLSGIRPLKVVVDAGNGMAGHTVPTVFAGLPIETVPLYFELDGNFPNHEANPHRPANLVDLQRGREQRRRRHRAWPSTATPTGASSSTSAARSSRRRC